MIQWDGMVVFCRQTLTNHISFSLLVEHQQNIEITATLKDMAMLESTHDTTPLSKIPRANSLGEELFLIHLKRTTMTQDANPEDVEDDHDYEKPRHPKKSIGEELFEVHLKRSKGMEPDYDIDAKSFVDVAGKYRYNLRNHKH